ncbi:hypothetical protein GCM10023350_49810 [Nocardioides endophyticus]|uniref:Glycosyltransferase 2-like domain-containing protein n=1 Tax=Nocardioides endophyticus TaxID=1353775 RepID=A0ABP8ZJ25_9ACTN
MSDDAVVGFMVPHHGSFTYLRAAVESALAQSDERWSMTVVEDGADRRVGAWLRSLDDPRIVHEQNPVRLGIAGNFQRCLDLSRTMYVTFLGNDDILLPNYVETIVSATAAYPRATVVQPRVQVIDADGQLCWPIADRVKARMAPQPRQAVELAGEPLVTSLMRGNWTYFPSLCWRREHISWLGFRQDLPTTLDLALLADVLIAEGTMVMLPEVAFQYRRHAASASSAAARDADRFGEEAALLDELAVRCHTRGWERACRAARVRLTSRLHAAQIGLAAAHGRDWGRTGTALSHALTPSAHARQTTS